MISELAGERRFASTVAKRLESLVCMLGFRTERIGRLRDVSSKKLNVARSFLISAGCLNSRRQESHRNQRSQQVQHRQQGAKAFT